jgi:glycosyltransferase involved in cell wall biosynthesis
LQLFFLMIQDVDVVSRIPGERSSAPLTVLNIAFPLAPVGPDAVGGAEQVLTALDETLVRAGHRSIVLACEGSACRGELVATPNWGKKGENELHELDEETWREAHRCSRSALQDALRRFVPDVLHFHGVDFAAYLPPPGPPVLATLHLPLSHYHPESFFPGRPRTYLHCVSQAHHDSFPPEIRRLDPVSNGVDLELYRPWRRKEPFALALGRICPEKGFHLAAEAAEKARLPLRIGGQVFPFGEHLRYFQEELEPLLNRPGSCCRFLGPLERERKRRLLAAARCLLIPSQVDETSSLAAMEALASGTPVIAFRRGALAEIIEPGRTGFLVSDVAEMAEAISAVEGIDPAECRRAAVERFSFTRTAETYLGLYRRLAAESGSRDAVPMPAGEAHVVHAV